MLNLVELKNDIRTVFIGDTHGDPEASQKVVKLFPAQNNRLIFLGDYVDRGTDSLGNVEFLFGLREKYPDNVILLMGNHEMYEFYGFYPAQFWESLNESDTKKYSAMFLTLPLAVSIGNIIALHGGLPDLGSLAEINDIKISADDNQLRDILCSDFKEYSGYSFRPAYDQKYFDRVMAKISKQILVRGHDPNAPNYQYGSRLLTIFTTKAYLRSRQVAVLEKGQMPFTARDLELINIDN